MRWWVRCQYEARECSLPQRPTGSNRAPSVLTQLVPGTDTPTSCSAPGMFQGFAGETITSAGNRLVHSGFHTSNNPPQPGLSKPTCVGTADMAAEGERPSSRLQCTCQEDVFTLLFILIMWDSEHCIFNFYRMCCSLSLGIYRIGQTFEISHNKWLCDTTINEYLHF